MQTVSLFEAKTHLSRLVEELVEGREKQIIISRHGKPVARISAFRKIDTSKRIGLARGRFKIPDDIDGSNAALLGLMTGAGTSPGLNRKSIRPTCDA